MLLVALLSMCAEAGKVSYSVKVLQKQKCRKSEKVRRGDSIRVLLSASADTGAGDHLASDGTAEQEFIVGKHGVPPINKGVVGMCVGEARRVRVRVEQQPGAVSDPMDYVVQLLGRSIAANTEL